MRRYRSLIALLVALSMLFAMSVTAGAAPFSDVDEDSEYADAFQLLKDLEIFEGYGDGTVGPNDPLTREQFAVVVVRALGVTRAANNLANFVTHFTDDADISDWARGAVAYASARIIQGYPDGSFRPQANVTYAEAYTMLIRALRLDREGVEGPWPISILALAERFGLTEGIGGFHNAPINRGDMAKATENALFTSWKWNHETEEFEKDNTGESSLIVKVHGWDEDDWADRMDLARVAGTVDRVTASGAIRMSDGKTYSVADYDDLVVELNDSEQAAEDEADAALQPDGFDGWNRDSLRALLDAVEDDIDRVVLVLDKDDNKVEEIHVYVNTFPNWDLNRVTVERNETEFGEIRVRIPGDQVTVRINDDTDVLVNGEKANLADVRDALADFRSEWGNDADAIATVQTIGNDKADNADAILLSVITDKVVSGEVTGRGSDSGGRWVRIDGTKYYIGEDTVELETGVEVSVLLGHDDKVYTVLDGEPVEKETTYARALSYEIDRDNRYVTEFQAPDGSRFTLRVDVDQEAIDDALDTEHGLVLIVFDNNGDLTGVSALADVGSEDDGEVSKITSTQIEVEGVPYTLAPDVFWWDDDAEEFIRRTDIFTEDEVEIWTHPDTGLVTVVFLNPQP